ncbi:MAG: hypothetical protein ACSLFN_12900 [Candidatus Limnocylindrales bacterium]
MTPGAVLAASLLASLASPSTWVLGLLGFLVRGGFLVVMAPIVVVPSAVGLANIVAPTLTSMVFGGLSPEIAVLVVGGVLAAAAWLVLGGMLTAAAEAEAVQRIAEDEDVTIPRRSGLALRILQARTIAAAPLAIALGLGVMRVVAVAYRELTVPSEVAVPVAVRIIRGAPDAVAAIVLAWVAAEILGAVAARRIVLHGDGPAGAVLHAVGHAIRHPLRVVVAFGVPLVVLAAVVVPSAAAAAVTWDAIRGAIADDAGPYGVGGLLVAFIGLWGGGLVLIGMVSAWRSAVWTVEVARTFGAVPTALPGEWTASPGAATLADLRSPGADPDPR